MAFGVHHYKVLKKLHKYAPQTSWQKGNPQIGAFQQLENHW